ncbi:inovirus-type Gp2 protein [Shewanella sp. TB4-MNA-CIBAN-0142]|uniref:YagK/YfjJ domain-containing protein n=1 Tax=Shewanella sp. TB4-MNA-CIBAN-0142 TaxID=3140464 RepID=UPI00331C43D2
MNRCYSHSTYANQQRACDTPYNYLDMNVLSFSSDYQNVLLQSKYFTKQKTKHFNTSSNNFGYSRK